MWLRASSDIAPVITEVLIFYSIMNAQNISRFLALINSNKPRQLCAGFELFISICALRSVGVPVARAQNKSDVYFHSVSLTTFRSSKSCFSYRKGDIGALCERNCCLTDLDTIGCADLWAIINDEVN